MVEGEMNDPIRPGSARLQGVQVFGGTAMDLGPRGRQSRLLVGRATQTEHIVARGDQLADYGRSNKAGGTGDEYTHDQILQVLLETNLSQ